jgi:hypothetical protein
MVMLTAENLPAAVSTATALVLEAAGKYRGVVGQDLPLEELERLEAELDEARKALSSLEGHLRNLRDNVRLALVKAGADGWVSEHGVIYCDGGLAELAE